MKQLAVQAAAAILVLAGVYLGFWAYWTSTVDQPFDEVWIGLNAPLPQPLRAWSCGKVRARLARAALAPHGCEGLWR